MAEMKPGQTVKGVGWISQVQIKPDDAEPIWMSWTQWKEQNVAERHAAKLLERPDALQARVVRVDWTASLPIDRIEERRAPKEPA